MIFLDDQMFARDKSELKGQRILVTGSDGFLGAHLISGLKQKGADIISVDIRTGVNITKWQDIKDYTGIDIIYHLAAKTYIPETFEDPRETYFNNLVGTVNMLELAKKNRTRNFIFASAYVYGTPQYLPIDEDHPVNPLNPYSRSKVLGEELCKAYHEDYGLRCMIVRAFNLYGEGQSNKFLIPTLMEQIKGREIVLRNPEPRRDFVYIKDAVEAYISIGEYCGSDYDTFNIGSGVSYSVDEIVNKIVAISGKKVEVRYLNERRKNEILNTVASIAKAKAKLGWKPKFGIEMGLKNTLTSYLTNPHDKAAIS